jgi:peptide/nickel transport system ATP-binding protein
MNLQQTVQAQALLKIEGLCVEGRQPNGGWATIVHDLNVEVCRGQVLALIGESGAGKSTAALAALGYTRPG